MKKLINSKLFRNIQILNKLIIFCNSNISKSLNISDLDLQDKHPIYSINIELIIIVCWKFSKGKIINVNFSNELIV